MIIELENKEKEWMQNNKDIRLENTNLREILTEDLNVIIPIELQKKTKDDKKKEKKSKKDRHKNKQDKKDDNDKKDTNDKRKNMNQKEIEAKT